MSALLYRHYQNPANGREYKLLVVRDLTPQSIQAIPKPSLPDTWCFGCEPQLRIIQSPGQPLFIAIY